MDKVQFTKKYRPRTFDSVVGQNEAVSVLKNSVANDNLLNFILLKGTRGSGKCFCEDEFILTKQGYVKAKSLKPTQELGDYQYNGSFVNLNGQLEQAEYYHSDGVRPCILFRSEYGSELKVTKNHPLLVFDNEQQKICYKKAELITEEDKLIMQFASNRFGKSPIKDDLVAATTYIELGLFTASLIRGNNLDKACEQVATILNVPIASVHASLSSIFTITPETLLEFMMTKSENNQLCYILGLLKGSASSHTNAPNDLILVDSTIYIEASKEFHLALQTMLFNLGVVPRVTPGRISLHNQAVKDIAVKLIRISYLIKSEILSQYVHMVYIRSLHSHSSTLDYVRNHDLDSDVDLDEFYYDSFFAKIITIEDAGELPTLDFCMPTTHSFVVNGVVNHNTTLARIYAAAVNCEHPVDGNPCLECPSCQEVFGGTSQDIIEIDAASKRTIDDMRNLAKQLDYATFALKYRVIILDEVHSLTPEAWQSLLKTLEEPRDNAIFIMCTTDPEKIPDTILSRAVSLTVKRIRAIDIISNLKNICEKEGLSYEDNALGIIARKSGGIMRDAVKDLDTVNSVFGEVTSHKTSEIFAVVDLSEITQFISCVFNEDISVILNETRSLENMFPNSQKFLAKLYTTLLDCVQLKLGVNLLDKYSQDEVQLIQKVITSIPTKFLWKFINVIKEQLDSYNAELPVLDYCALAMKQDAVEETLGVLEKKEEQHFDINSALDDL